jgi:hypothetical protein
VNVTLPSLTVPAGELTVADSVTLELESGLVAFDAAVALDAGKTVNVCVESELPVKSVPGLYTASIVYVPVGVPAGSE